MGDGKDWFDGDPRDEREAAFLAELRAARWAWADTGLAPADTSAETYLVPLLILVDVPWVPSGYHWFHIAFWPAGRAESIQAEWGNDHILDNGHFSHDLHVAGIDLDPVEAAGIVARWIRHQLGRPIRRDDWLDSGGTVIASRWLLADTDESLAGTGSWLVRRRPPSTSSLVHPTS